MHFPKKIHAFKFSKKLQRYEKNGLSFDPVTRTAVGCGRYVFLKEITGQLFMSDPVSHNCAVGYRIAANHRRAVRCLVQALDMSIEDVKFLSTYNACGLHDLDAAEKACAELLGTLSPRYNDIVEVRLSIEVYRMLGSS
jgi:hypothetical protein